MDMDLIDEVVDFVFDGTVDPREVRDYYISKMNDASEVHIPGASTKPPKPSTQPKQKRSLKNKVGTGLNALAMGAGTHALVMAGRDERLKVPGERDAAAGKKSFARVASAPYRKWAATKIGQKTGKMGSSSAKFAIPLAGGALALHGAELVGDSIAAQALHQQGKQQTIKKSVDDIMNLRRMGRITTDKALELIDKAYEEVMFTCGECGGPSPENQAWCDTCLEVKASYARAEDRQPVGKSLSNITVRDINPGPVDDGDAVDLGWDGSISKVDTDKRQVFGWCSLTEVNGEKVVDRQGDYIPLDEVEKSAYNYVIHSRKGGDMHKRDGEQPLHTSDMIESFVVTPEKLDNLGLEPDSLPHGWWVGFKINDDKQWDEVKKGDKVHFSIHGKGKRVEKSVD